MAAVYDCNNCACHDCKHKEECGRCKLHQSVRHIEKAVFNPCIHCYKKDYTTIRKAETNERATANHNAIWQRFTQDEIPSAEAQATRL